MSEFVKPRAHRIAELKESIEAQIQLKRYHWSNHLHRERFLEQCQKQREQAARIIADAERLEHSIANWRALYDAAEERMMELRQELLILENEKQLAELERIAAQLLGADAEEAVA
jgi:hypothetical protein